MTSSPIAAVPAVVAGAAPAYALYRTVAGRPHAAERVLVRGGGGTGKSALVAAIRHVLRSAQVATADSLRRFDPAGHSALLIDDAHLLPPSDLHRLTDLAYHEELTLVITVQPRYQYPELAALMKTFEAVGRTVDLSALDELGVAASARALFGAPVSAEFASTVSALTDGLSYLVEPCLRRANPRLHGDVAQRATAAVRDAVADKLLRLGRDVVRVIALSNFGADPDEVKLGEVLQLGDGQVCAIYDEATNCGLLHPGTDLARIVAAEVTGALGHPQVAALAERYYRARGEEKHLDPELAANLAECGVRDTHLCRALLAEAVRQVGGRPRLAERYYRAAIDAAPSDGDLLVERADAAFRIGRFDDALRLAEVALEDSTSTDVTTAARVAASTWCARGLLKRGADLYTWLGPQRVGEDGAIAAMLLVCAGDAKAATAMAESPGTRPPTADVSGHRLLAQALLTSLRQPGPATLNLFSRSLTVLDGSSTRVVTPDDVAAVTAIAALHVGDLRKARTVLRRALDSGSDSAPVSVRLRLLMAWTMMLEGHLEVAGCELAAVGGRDLPSRERFFVDALHVGLARRRADVGQLHIALAQARESIDDYSVDLLSLLPVGELWAGASRVGEAGLVRHLVDDAFALTDSLGGPPFWTCAMHWYGLTVAIRSDSPSDVTRHARALRAAAEQSEYAAALAAAGRAWVRALNAELDMAELTMAVTGLQSFGHGWDAANLASRAALRCADNRMSAELLHLARVAGQPAPGSDSTVVPAHVTADMHTLSDRQREVAALLVAGLTYKGVGERLFISPKTVEYHVAKIKRVMGTDSRSELISRLHALERNDR
ncbi:LuxR C-terminal-related transcriptional regulator [Mycolicibacterium litorale]|uniref:LuxR family transcriptional regulator n=2 Tax=Mycolicibacterium litorale TaxID=758802 RepID=A0AAD1IGQ6_9MYCO|nr:LuxR C-terminal-related transcriptional regulator [Mycolicibacterium litorale]TDY03400.1 regulatory LuxR family protein [Mycolicibacterium litorale]BBY15197.1 LuxR family transcriptional regulator [Mycolicibacterium litorale]